MLQFFQELLRQLSARECVELSATCCSLGITYLQHRTKRWLVELLERERRRADDLRLKERQTEFYRHKETVRTALEATSQVQPLTFEELAENRERDFSIRSSTPSSIPPKPRL